MLKVIGAGFPRTGTSSMKAALERLGFGPCYHMFEILTKPEHADRWVSVVSGEKVDWDQVFDGYQSAQDWPASGFWREQAAAYPDAKVILTVRDPHRWYISMQNLLSNGPGGTMSMDPSTLPPAAAKILEGMQKMQPVLSAIGEDAFGQGWSPANGLPDEKVAIEAFERHRATVEASLPASRLLVFDVREGWEPLCAFLDVEVPDEPFPHLNDSESLQRRMGELMAGQIPSSIVEVH
ncbi:sulfotransferase family protein [Nonomuraea aurantiaca]|uniref:sulfotransferase family protein n=1 Tax=Nonomuraea aurantiaca TaxID=2878562 RepID=UPI001CD9F660|nr:sulfotransferase family protein [Nonomuraea aurantiaca]MCA2225440.1 sulfotransferase family protein [Nonomuraea aurantiaca]